MKKPSPPPSRSRSPGKPAHTSRPANRNGNPVEKTGIKWGKSPSEVTSRPARADGKPSGKPSGKPIRKSVRNAEEFSSNYRGEKPTGAGSSRTRGKPFSKPTSKKQGLGEGGGRSRNPLEPKFARKDRSESPVDNPIDNSVEKPVEKGAARRRSDFGAQTSKPRHQPQSPDPRSHNTSPIASNSRKKPGKTNRQTGDNRETPIPAKPAQSPSAQSLAHAYIYGRHAAAIVLANPARTIKSIYITKSATLWLIDRNLRDVLIAHKALEVEPETIDSLLPPGSVHQGIAVLADPLPALDIDDIASSKSNGPVIVLDQITDPQNIGAILRTAAAFDARALIMQDRHSPAITGALAKAAAGAVDLVPVIRAVNIARSLDALKKLGFFCVGMAGSGAVPLAACEPGPNLALVLGAEGSGLRPLVAKSCDQLVHIPIAAQVESLNVSAAAAIALYRLCPR